MNYIAKVGDKVMFYENDEYETSEQKHRIVWDDSRCAFMDYVLKTYAMKNLDNPDIDLSQVEIIGTINDQPIKQ